MEFCSNCLSETESIGIPKFHHAHRFEDRGTKGLNVKSMDQDIVLEAYFYVLNNLSVVEPHIATQKTFIKKNIPEWMTSGCWQDITRNS